MSESSEEGTNHLSSPVSPATWDYAYRKYLRFWMNLAKTIYVSEEEAKDIVHSVLSAILAGAPKDFETMEHLRNYVGKAVLNRAIAHKQRNDRLSGWTENTELRFSVNPEVSGIDQRMQTEALKEAILHLPRRDFEIIKLRFYSGFTFNEISQILDLSISTLKSREDAAIKRIRRWLRKKGM
jgi:RNA polymerase sigma factor (sigma-70 family)